MKFKLLTVLLCISSYGLTQSYNYYFDGDTSDVSTTPAYGVCLMGGASENDQGAQWFLNKADGGNVLVLRTSGSDGYQNYFYNDLGVTVQSVETIVLNNSTAATDPFVLERIENAEAIWLAGGDQYLYELYFKNSTIKTLLNNHVNVKGAPIGGTSAGMAILGEYYFNAENGTITSSEALNDPYDQNLTVESDFLEFPFLENTITDTHYDNPDRKGRHLAFIARIQETSTNEDYFGIAADEFVAICIDENGIATVFGEYPDFEDNAYFLRTNCQRTQPTVLQSGTPMTWNGNEPAILSCNIKGTTNGENQFDLNTWLEINDGSWSGWSVDQGDLTENQIQFNGCSASTDDADSKMNTLTIFPNPTDDIINIQSKDNIESVELFDMRGKLITSEKEVNQLYLSSFEKGVYQLRITNSNDKSLIRKVILK